MEWNELRLLRYPCDSLQNTFLVHNFKNSLIFIAMHLYTSYSRYILVLSTQRNKKHFFFFSSKCLLRVKKKKSINIYAHHPEIDNKLNDLERLGYTVKFILKKNFHINSN